MRLVGSAALGTWGHNRDRENLRFWGHLGSLIEIANTSSRQRVSHRERAPEREEGVWGENVAPPALLQQLLEREVQQLRTPRRVCVREDATTVLSEEPIVYHTFLWLQHFALLLPVDCAKRVVDSLGWAASVAHWQVAVEHRVMKMAHGAMM